MMWDPSRAARKCQRASPRSSPSPADAAEARVVAPRARRGPSLDREIGDREIGDRERIAVDDAERSGRGGPRTVGDPGCVAPTGGTGLGSRTARAGRTERAIRFGRARSDGELRSIDDRVAWPRGLEIAAEEHEFAHREGFSDRRWQTQPAERSVAPPRAAATPGQGEVR